MKAHKVLGGRIVAVEQQACTDNAGCRVQHVDRIEIEMPNGKLYALVPTVAELEGDYAVEVMVLPARARREP